MRKLLLSALMATVFQLGTSAQTVISNDYGSPITGADGQTTSTSSSDEKESLTSINLVYYGFDGFQNYGLSDYFLNPNGIGWELNIRANFEKYGNYNFELGPNYSFQLWGEGNKHLLLTAAVGPSVRTQSYNNVTIDSNGRTHDEMKTKVKFDLFANARLGFNVGHVMFSVGYFLWGAEFKFEKGYKADGFNLALGYTF